MSKKINFEFINMDKEMVEFLAKALEFSNVMVSAVKNSDDNLVVLTDKTSIELTKESMDDAARDGDSVIFIGFASKFKKNTDIAEAGKFMMNMKNTVNNVLFVKKDGTYRVATVTRDLALIPPIDHPKGTDGLVSEGSNLPYYDLDESKWKSLIPENIVSIRSFDASLVDDAMQATSILTDILNITISMYEASNKNGDMISLMSKF